MTLFRFTVLTVERTKKIDKVVKNILLVTSVGFLEGVSGV